MIGYIIVGINLVKYGVKFVSILYLGYIDIFIYELMSGIMLLIEVVICYCFRVCLVVRRFISSMVYLFEVY